MPQVIDQPEIDFPAAFFMVGTNAPAVQVVTIRILPLRKLYHGLFQGGEFGYVTNNMIVNSGVGNGIFPCLLCQRQGNFLLITTGSIYP